MRNFNLLRSNYWSGVLSSLAAAVIISWVSWISDWKPLTSSVPAWVVVLLVIVLVGVTTMLILFLRSQPRRVLVMVSAFTRFHFFSDLLRELLKELDRNHLQAVVKVPSRDFSAPAQSRILAGGILHRRAYVGAILVPIRPHEHRDELRNFVGRFRKPVVFLDTEPSWEENEYPASSAFVGFDDYKGGQLAGKAVAAELGANTPLHPKILVIAGPYHERRQEGFTEYLKVVCPAVSFTIDSHGEFARSAARDLARQHLELALRKESPYDAVFCTNDAMALGVLDALSDFPKESFTSLILVGYDAIEEATLNIDRLETQFKNTVCQNREELAEQAVILLTQLLSAEKPRHITRLEPSLQRVAMAHEAVLETATAGAAREDK